MRSRFIPLVTVALLLPGACTIDWWDAGFGWDSWYQDKAETTEVFSVPAADLDGFFARTHNGSITVIGAADAAAVSVTARIEARGESPEDATANLADVRLTRDVRGRRLMLSWEWAEPQRRNRSASISYTIEAPPQLAAELESHNGVLSVTGWNGDLRGETHNGEVDLEGSFGTVELTTHNGPITARLRGTGALNGTLETHNGEVQIEVSEQLSARIVASTDNGEMSYSGRLDRVEAGRHFLVGDVGEGSGRLRISTHNGDVTIR